MGTLAMGAIVLLTSVLGCATGKFKKPCFALPFIILTAIMGLILLIVGAVALSSGEVFQKVKDEACAQDSTIQNQYKNTVDRYVCSQECPCPAGENDQIKKLWRSLPQSVLRDNGRKKDEGTAGGEHPLVFKNDGDTYSTFVECYQAKLRDSGNNDIQQFFDQGGEAFLKSLEEEYECASICKVPLFYLATDVSMGRPTQECGGAMIEAVKGGIGTLGVVCVITGLIVIIAMIGAYPLCTGFSNKDE